MTSPSLVTLLLTFFTSVLASPLPSLLTGASSALSTTRFAADTLSPPGTSPVALPLAKRFNSTGSANVVRFDQARARAIRARTQQTSGDGAIGTGFSSDEEFDTEGTSQAVSYVVTVSIGEPSTDYQLLVDTGSSNTWVGAGKRFVPSTSTQFTNGVVEVQYGSGSFIGVEVFDTITLANGLTIQNQSIGVAITSQGFDGLDGILGIGPRDLTCGSLLTSPDECFNTVIDNAWDAGSLSVYEVGISFHPSQYINQKNGELTFGGVDPSKYRGSLQYVPLTTTDPAAEFVGYEQSITYGDMDHVLMRTSGILDTGTTLVLLASDAFERYQELTGGVPDNATGLLRITQEQYGNLQNLKFNIGDAEYALTPDAQIWPRALNEAIGGDTEGIYLIVNDLQSESGGGLDFINGMSFLERFYAVYDIGSSRVGFAETPYTGADTNY
ncbi:aspartic peptidase A1 [Trametes punicea]|nr:aspartic peptidase A1 [Trametes punicea]